ncbi:MAG: flippase-like domain-containing protein [Candidatus Gastranaerophilales bacterium]|nr:flippase-like domain-containing protein [Candidatus Gastranaerophilales bacterium]
MKTNIKKILLFLITLIFLYFVFVNLDIKEFLIIIKKFDVRYIFLLTASMIISFSFRAVCFKYLIFKTVNPPLKELIPLCITCASLNIILPARAGDIFRAFFAGQKYNVNKLKIFGSVMFERILDVFIIFCFLCLGVFLYHRNEIAMQLCTFAGICMLFASIFTVIAYKFNKTDEICKFISEKTSSLSFSQFIEKIIGFINKSCNSFFNGFEVIDSPKNLITALFASFWIWFFEAMNFLIVIYGFGYNGLHWSISIFIVCFIAMACMIPSTSIFIGPYQVAIIAAFSIYNVNKETALAVSFVEQIIVTFVTVIIAGIFLLKNNISYKELKEDISSQQI